MTEKPTTPTPAQERKRYEAPTLIEYGDIAKLTQTGGLTSSDGAGSRKQKVG